LNRPLGVTILGILLIIGGISLLFHFHPVSFALAIANFILAWGLLSGKGWAWFITVILAIISIIFAIVSMVMGNYEEGIATVIIEGIILYYLFRPNVKAYFGRSTTTTI
jgi:hypothetical protein